MSLVIDEHRQFLADANRVAAFEQAIRETIRPGDVVVDLGFRHRDSRPPRVSCRRAPRLFD